MARHAFIVGGTGQIGRAVAAELLGRGWRVTLSARGDRPVDDGLARLGAVFVALDREEPGGLARALGGGADAVIDTIAYTRDHADQLLEVQGDVGAYVVVSSSSVYRDAAGRSLDEAGETGFPDLADPITEDQSTVDPGPQTYSTRKVALEQRLLQDCAAPVTILRPCAIHGAGSVHPREWWFVKRMLDGRPVIPLAYRGESRFHTSAATNIAALAGIVLDRPASRILNIADPEALTVGQIGAAIAAHMGYAGSILPLDVGDANGVSPIGDTPWSVPAPFTLNLDAAAALGYRPATTYRDAVGGVCDWLVGAQGDDWSAAFPVLASYPIDLFDYAAEDAFLAGSS